MGLRSACCGGGRNGQFTDRVYIDAVGNRMTDVMSKLDSLASLPVGWDGTAPLVIVPQS